MIRIKSCVAVYLVITPMAWGAAHERWFPTYEELLARSDIVAFGTIVELPHAEAYQSSTGEVVVFRAYHLEVHDVFAGALEADVDPYIIVPGGIYRDYRADRYHVTPINNIFLSVGQLLVAPLQQVSDGRYKLVEGTPYPYLAVGPKETELWTGVYTSHRELLPDSAQIPPRSDSDAKVSARIPLRGLKDFTIRLSQLPKETAEREASMEFLGTSDLVTPEEMLQQLRETAAAHVAQQTGRPFFDAYFAPAEQSLVFPMENCVDHPERCGEAARVPHADLFYEVVFKDFPDARTKLEVLVGLDRRILGVHPGFPQCTAEPSSCEVKIDLRKAIDLAKSFGLDAGPRVGAEFRWSPQCKRYTWTVGPGGKGASAHYGGDGSYHEIDATSGELCGEFFVQSMH